MPKVMCLYLDDSGTRNPDRKVPQQFMVRDWFALGGFLTKRTKELSRPPMPNFVRDGASPTPSIPMTSAPKRETSHGCPQRNSIAWDIDCNATRRRRAVGRSGWDRPTRFAKIPFARCFHYRFLQPRARVASERCNSLIRTPGREPRGGARAYSFDREPPKQLV